MCVCVLIGLMGEVILHRDQVNEDVNIDVMYIPNGNNVPVSRTRILSHCGIVDESIRTFLKLLM